MAEFQTTNYLVTIEKKKNNSDTLHSQLVRTKKTRKCSWLGHVKSVHITLLFVWTNNALTSHNKIKRKIIKKHIVFASGNEKYRTN